ncbi:MAG: transporter [Epulopiscium sp. Nuni2H_MBin003]|nr:MAG: transporter [Epulopiscium sp. Nuni2H_MBin003]
MHNELLLLITLIIYYGAVIIFYRYLGVLGLLIWTCIATICANIEVVLIIEAFGQEQPLGNILFASTFLVTDILSENEGRKFANKAVLIGVISSISFVIMSRIFLMFTPSASDFAYSSMQIVFKNTPRIIFVSIIVYLIAQVFDVFIYHKIWELTTKKFGNSNRMLFLRNNISTLLSQLINSFLFNYGAFYGIYEADTVFSIFISSYVIYAITSICDTPLLYLSRYLKDNNYIKTN